MWYPSLDSKQELGRWNLLNTQIQIRPSARMSESEAVSLRSVPRSDSGEDVVELCRVADHMAASLQTQKNKEKETLASREIRGGALENKGRCGLNTRGLLIWGQGLAPSALVS